MGATVNLLACDPGVSKRGQGNALARFHRSRLFRVGYLRAADLLAQRLDVLDLGLVGEPDTLVIERPQVDGRTQAAVKDVLALDWEAALFAGLVVGYTGAALVECTPRDWKGTTPKPIVHRRAWGALSAHERSVLGGDPVLRAIEAAVERGAKRNWPPGLDAYGGRAIHNPLDAVAIGLWHLGRV